MQQQYAQQSTGYPQSQAQTPLHFLSEVATGQQQYAGDMSYSNSHGGYNANSGWYPQQMEHPTGPGQIYMGNSANMGGYGQQQPADPGFETAMDLTMSIGEGDLSSLFMDGGSYGFGDGMIPEGNMGVFGGGGW